MRRTGQVRVEQMMQRWRMARGVFAMAVFGATLGWCLAPQGAVESAQAQERPAPQNVSLEGAQGRLDAINKELSRVESGPLQAELINARFSAETRLNDARIAYELGQHDRAAFLFLDVISRTTPAEFPGYRTALFYLAESLIKQRNFLGARQYLRELVALGRGEHYEEALGKLLEIAYVTNNYDGVEALYAELATNTKPAVNYLRGKALFEQGRHGEARSAFEQAAQDPLFAYRGVYFAGVALVSEGRLDDAMALFERVTARVPPEPADLHIYNLGFLALGRIDYERERYDSALNHYTSVDRNDPAFIKAMYESAWANIQLEKLEQAERMIDILISAEPDVDTYTKALLLRADLAQRNKNYEKALEDYETLLERYDPVREQLSQFAAERGDLRAFFQGLVRDDLSLQVPDGLPNIRTDFRVMPPEVWMNEDEQLQRTKQLVDDVAVTRANLRSAYEDLRQIEARITSGTRVKSFPKLAENMALVVGLESELIAVQRGLVDRQSQLIAGRLSGADAPQWATLSGDIKVLGERYAAVPRDTNELKAREKSVGADFQRLRNSLGDVGEQIDQVRAELAAIDIFLQTQQVILSEEERARVDELRRDLRDTVVQLEESQRLLRSELEVSRERASGGDAVTDEERKLRALYRTKLAQASDFLHQRASLAGGSGDLATIERVRGQIPALGARLQGFYEKLDAVVGDKIADVRQTVDALRASLDEQSAELEVALKGSREVAGEIAYQTFVRREQQFEGVILRADVGKIDVLFTQKEATSNAINELFQLRTDELRALQEAFEDLR